MTQPTIEDFDNGKEDLDNISLFTNSPDPTFVTRLGDARKTISGITAEYPAAAANAAAAAASAATAEAARDDAVDAKDAAEAAAASVIASGHAIGDIKMSSALDLTPLWVWHGATLSRTTYSLLFAATTKTMAATATPGVPGSISATNTLIAGDKISFETTGTLPAPFAVGVDYFVCSASLSGSSLRVSTTLANAEAGVAIIITTAGTGTLTLRHNPHGCGDGLTTFNAEEIVDFPGAASATRPLGSFQADAIQNITGIVAGFSNNEDGNGISLNQATGPFYKTSNNYTALPVRFDGSARNYSKLGFDASRVVRTSTVTRPRNTAVNYMIFAGV